MTSKTISSTSAGTAQEAGLALHGQAYASTNHVGSKPLPAGSPVCTLAAGRQQVAIGSHGFHAPGQSYGV